MDILEHYVNMRLAFPTINENQEVLTTTADLAGTLSCTIRNTNLIMKKMIENGWIQWTPQKGRGKRSTLIFRMSILESASLNVNRLIQERRIEEAYRFATSTDIPPTTKGVLLNILQNQFGFHSTSESSKRIDILKIPTNTIIHTLDPAGIAIVHEAHIVSQIFDTLIRYDHQSKSFKPVLALGWEEKHNGKEWTFYLRKGVLFHHGRTLTAKDVQFTFQRLKLGENPSSKGLFDIIEKVEVYDEVTVHFTLRARSYLFLDLISCFFASILPYDVPFNKIEPIGTGPFRLCKQEENLLVLEAFPNYFFGRPYLDKIEFWHVPKTYVEETNSLPKEEEHDKESFKELGSFFFVFNMHRDGIHHDQNFRLALKHILNQQQLVAELGLPRRLAAKSFLVDYSEKDQTSDSCLERAKEYLSLSDYSGERIKVGTFSFKEAIDDVCWLKEQCEKIGLHLEVHVFPLSKIYEQDELNKYDILYTGETFEENEQLSLFILFQSESSILRVGLNNRYREKLDSLLREVDREPVYINRIEKFNNIENWLFEEAIVLLTYHTLEVQSYHKALNGIEVTGFGMPDFRHLWVKRSQEDTEPQASYSFYIP